MLMMSLRRFRTLIFWVFAEKDVLYPRLDARVDKMTEVSLALSAPKMFADLSLLQLGLLDEINELWNLTQSPTETNYSRGIFQSIGAHPVRSLSTLAHPSSRLQGIRAVPLLPIYHRQGYCFRRKKSAVHRRTRQHEALDKAIRETASQVDQDEAVTGGAEARWRGRYHSSP